MTETVVILTEAALVSSDVDQIVGLFGTDPNYRLLVPVESGERSFTALIDELLIADFQGAADVLRGDEPTGREAAEAANAALGDSLELLGRAGATSTGTVINGKPVPVVIEVLKETRALQLVVVTEPHFLEDTFHQDWASRLREKSGVPVVHLIGATNRLID